MSKHIPSHKILAGIALMLAGATCAGGEISNGFNRCFTVVEIGPETAPTNRIVRRVDAAPIRIARFAGEVRALGTGGLTPVDGHSGSLRFWLWWNRRPAGA